MHSLGLDFQDRFRHASAAAPQLRALQTPKWHGRMLDCSTRLHLSTVAFDVSPFAAAPRILHRIALGRPRKIAVCVANCNGTVHVAYGSFPSRLTMIHVSAATQLQDHTSISA